MEKIKYNRLNSVESFTSNYVASSAEKEKMKKEFDALPAKNKAKIIKVNEKFQKKLNTLNYKASELEKYNKKLERNQKALTNVKDYKLKLKKNCTNLKLRKQELKPGSKVAIFAETQSRYEDTKILLNERRKQLVKTSKTEKKLQRENKQINKEIKKINKIKVKLT